MNLGGIMKKLISIILIFVLAFSLASCKKTMTVSNPNPTQEPLQSTMPGSAESQTSQTSDQDKQGQGNTAISNNNSNTVAGKSTPGNGAGISTPLKNNGSINNGTINNAAGSTNNSAGSASNSNQSGPKPTENVTIPEVPKNTVTISITGPSSRGVIVAKTRIDFKKGDTVLDALKRIAMQKNFDLDVTGFLPSMKLVIGIDNIYQGAEGPGSGWQYAIEGKSGDRSCGSYELKDGDDIEWCYTLNLGKDIVWKHQ